ncbi:MAG: hemerythrin family protein [Desulfuromonadales bacterium]|nr:hemerythrin family protein [Desulfuromonadales bacterium]
MKLEWTEDLALGDAEIDDQHKEIFARFNRFNTACNQGRAQSELRELYVFLLDYVKKHFEYEQRAHLETGYPDRENHKCEHEKFAGEIQELEKSLDKRTAASMVVQTSLTLSRWLIRHIQMSDQAFVRFLRDKNRE